MKNKRYITSVVYVVVLLLLLTFKWLVADWGAIGFDALFCAISVIGCLEFFRAVKIVPLAQRGVSIAFCATIVPMFALCEMLGADGYLPSFLVLIVYAIVVVVFALVSFDGSNWNTTLLSLGAMGYCGVLSLTCSAVNHLHENSTAAVLLMFLIVMRTDSFAYVTGKTLKRWLPYKLAPKISPNKTVVGGVGGLIGGMAAGVAAYYLWYGMSMVTGDPLSYSSGLPAVVAFLLLGFVGAVVGQAGDLFESYIKRRCGIKDSGNILPGHGGVLDRFDSLFFVSVLVLVGFLLFTI